MATWQIFLIVVCGLIYLFAFSGVYTDYQRCKKGGYNVQMTWRQICIIVFAPLYALWALLSFPFFLLKDYCIEIKKHGGYRGYKEWNEAEKKKKEKQEIEWQKKRVEDERIEKVYKNKELRRDELPRSQDGIKHFELYGNILSDDWRDLVYIENEHNDLLNEFFKHHPQIELKHNIRVIYLPHCVQELTSDEILRYWNPCYKDKTLLFPNISIFSLLDEVCYPEDITKLKHGLITCSGWSYNHGAEYLHATYYQLEESDDNSILKQIEDIAKEAFKYNTGGLYSTVNRPHKDKNPTKDFADEQFGWEVYELVEEIRERVNRLEQRGVSRKLLKKLLSDERRLSSLVITEDLRIFLPDYNNIEIKMEPINKAVYLLFLRHPEGIIFKHLPDYRKELAEIYQKIKPYGLNDRAIQSIEDVTNPCLNSINEKCARIRGAFISQFDESLARHYYIYGNRGEAKKIDLPQDLVIWE